MFQGFDAVDEVPKCLAKDGRVCEGLTAKSCGLYYQPQCDIDPPNVKFATLNYK